MFVIKFSGVSFRSIGGQNPRFPIDFAGCRYNSAVQPVSIDIVLRVTPVALLRYSLLVELM